LIVGTYSGGSNSWHDRDQLWRQCTNRCKIAGRTHQSSALRIENYADSLFKRVQISLLTRKHGDTQTRRCGKTCRRCTVGDTFDSGSQMVDTSSGVDGEVRHSEGTHHSSCLIHRGGDIEKFQIGKDRKILANHCFYGLWASGAEKLKANFGDTKPGLQRMCDSASSDDVVDIECKRET
jgi:hypothetical protein